MIKMNKYIIGEVIDARSDKSFIYQSSKGVLNLDDWRDLEEAEREDESLLANE